MALIDQKIFEALDPDPQSLKCHSLTTSLSALRPHQKLSPQGACSAAACCGHISSCRLRAHALQGRDGGQWPGFFWGFIVGLQLALSSYVFGQHWALFISNVLYGDSSPDRPGNKDPAAEELEEDVEAQDAGRPPGGIRQYV